MSEEKKDVLRFRSCKSYKNGIYVFNLYRKRDFAFLLITFLLIFLVLNIVLGNPDVNIFSALGTAILVFLLAFFITLPIPNYHVLYYFFYYMCRFYLLPRKYLWKGWVYHFDEIAEETEND